MDIFTLIFAVITSTIFILFYIHIYRKYFSFRKYASLGIIFLLGAVYIQFVAIYLNIDIRIIALLSFISYPLAFLAIFKNNYLHNIFLSLNAILKIYAGFVLFGSIFAIISQTQYSVTWITNSAYYNFSQGLAYLLSIGSLLIVDNYLITDKLKFYFKLKANLLMVIFIQLILIINLIWLSASNTPLPQMWYNYSLVIIAFSVDIIYFLLRLYIANSSYYITFITHTETLKKQLDFQIEHYKNYEQQAQEFSKFKHDYNSILNGIGHLLNIKDYTAATKVIEDSFLTLNKTSISYQKYSNNLILDALLNDYAQRFERIGAKFAAKTYIKIPLFNELDLIRLFNNILDNAYESLTKVPVANKREMTIDTISLDDYFKLSFKNTTSDQKPISPKTSKSDKLNHGFGLIIINEIITKYNGFSQVYKTVADDTYYYHLEVFFPK